MKRRRAIEVWLVLASVAAGIGSTATAWANPGSDAAGTSCQEHVRPSQVLAPRLVALDPSPASVGIVPVAEVVAWVDVPLDPATVTAEAYCLFACRPDSSGAGEVIPVPTDYVFYDPVDLSVHLVPVSPLATGCTYTVTRCGSGCLPATSADFAVGAGGWELNGADSGSALRSGDATLGGEFTAAFRISSGLNRITGSVAGPDGLLVCGASVRLTGPGYATVLTDIAGFYESPELPAGDYTVACALPATSGEELCFEVTLAPESLAVRDFDFTAGGRLAVTVIGPDGVPVSAAGLRLIDGPAGGLGRSDASGQYTFHGLPPGQYTVGVDLPSAAGEDQRLVTTVATAQTTPLTCDSSNGRRFETYALDSFCNDSSGSYYFSEWYRSPDVQYLDVPFRVRTEGNNWIMTRLSGPDAIALPMGGRRLCSAYLLGVGTYIAAGFGHHDLYCDELDHLAFTAVYANGSREAAFPLDVVLDTARWSDILSASGAVAEFPARPRGFIHLYRVPLDPARPLSELVFEDRDSGLASYHLVALTLEPATATVGDTVTGCDIVAGSAIFGDASWPVYIAVGDATNDGRPDLVVSRHRDFGTGHLAVFQRDDAGRWDCGSIVLTGGNGILYPFVGDAANDGNQWLAYLVHGQGNCWGELRATRLSGTTVAETVVLDRTGWPGLLFPAIGDLDGDACNSVYATVQTGANVRQVHEYRPDSGGSTWADSLLVDSGRAGNWDRPLLADFTGAGKPSLVYAICTFDGPTELHLLTHDGTALVESTVYAHPTLKIIPLAAGNLDDAPGTDIAVALGDHPWYPAGEAVALISGGTFTASTIATSLPEKVWALACADLDGNGLDEVYGGGESGGIYCWTIGDDWRLIDTAPGVVWRDAARARWAGEDRDQVVFAGVQDGHLTVRAFARDATDLPAAWKVAVSLRNADRPGLEFGQQPGATADFDDGIDLDSPMAPPPQNPKGGAYFVGDLGFLYTRDIRPVAASDTWLLEVVANAEPVTLSWAGGQLPPGRSVTLARIGDDGQGGTMPGGWWDMGVAGTLTLPAVTVQWFTIRTPGHVEFALELKPGWNLVSLPIEPLDPEPTHVLGAVPDDERSGQTGSEALRDGQRATAVGGTVWEWLAAGANSRYQAATSLHALHGYWVHANEATTVRVLGVPVPAVLELQAGWNLVGPAAPCSVPTDAALAGHCWGWDAATQASVAAAAGGSLAPGAGYWLFARQPATLTLGR